jgi:hypothetical protein
MTIHREVQMFRSIRLTVAALAAIACFATAAHAMRDESSKGAPRFGLSAYLFGHNAPVLGGTAPVTLGLIGLGLELNGGLGQGHWGWAAGGGYGVGGFQDKVTGPSLSSTDEIDLTHYEIRVGFDYWDDCCDEYWYCGPGFVYESTTLTIKSTGQPEDKFKPYSVYGIDPRAGGAIKLGATMQLYAEMSMLIGYGSTKETNPSGAEFKQTGWFTQPGWRGGLRYVH